LLKELFLETEINSDKSIVLNHLLHTTNLVYIQIFDAEKASDKVGTNQPDGINLWLGMALIIKLIWEI